MAGRLLMIEDDPEMQLLVEDAIKGDLFTLDVISDGKGGLEKAVSGSYDLVILDLTLPQLNGFDVCRALRAKRPELMILMLTGRSSTVDKVLGLELGADDYLVKPFAPSELIARIRALLRRAQRSDLAPMQLRFGDLVIDGPRRHVERAGREIKLTAIEFDILFYLASHAGRVIARDELRKAIWNYQASEFDATITSHLSRVRSKIEPDPSSPVFIKTIHGVGYRFSDGETGEAASPDAPDSKRK